jgi:uncharacterized protein YkwD
MKFTLSNTIAALLLILGIFFSAATQAQAQTLTLPQQLSYAGLTFTEPLTYSKQLPLKTETLTFSLPQQVQVTPKASNKTLDEMVIIPTITTTLSVLPSQNPPSAFQSKENATETEAATPVSKVLAAAATIAPTIAPTETPVPIITTAPSTNAGGLDAEKLFSMSNAYRQSHGLAPFQKDDRSCSLAASRAPEINGEVASGTMHSGLRARALPYWNSENIITMNSEEAAFNWWINDKIHHDAIVGNYTYSCVACSGNACAQEFTNFQAK